QAARAAATELAPLPRAPKDAALRAMADALTKRAPEVLEANGSDVERARGDGASAGLVDRLTLTEARLDDIAAALPGVADLPAAPTTAARSRAGHGSRAASSSPSHASPGASSAACTRPAPP